MWTAGITARRRASGHQPGDGVRRKPDIIIVQCHAGADAARDQVEELYGRQRRLQSLKAVQNDKVYYLEKTLFHNKPNSRFAEAYQKLAEILYPDVEFSFQASN